MALIDEVEEKLRRVIDPETGMHVMRMKLVRYDGAELPAAAFS